MNFPQTKFSIDFRKSNHFNSFPAEIAEVSPYGFYREENHQALVMDIP